VHKQLYAVRYLKRRRTVEKGFRMSSFRRLKIRRELRGEDGGEALGKREGRKTQESKSG
jgi:hypothetical protein